MLLKAAGLFLFLFGCQEGLGISDRTFACGPELPCAAGFVCDPVQGICVRPGLQALGLPAQGDEDSGAADVFDGGDAPSVRTEGTSADLPPVCQDGPCCVGGTLAPKGTECAVKVEYDCPWSSVCGADLHRVTTRTLCPGGSSLCTGASVVEEERIPCGEREYCAPGQAACRPGVERQESLNGLDDNCDGRIDESLLNRFFRWFKTHGDGDFEHRFALEGSSPPGIGWEKEETWIEIYPFPFGTETGATVRQGNALLAVLSECSSGSPDTDTIYTIFEGPEHQIALANGWDCRPLGYVITNCSTAITYRAARIFVHYSFPHTDHAYGTARDELSVLGYDSALNWWAPDAGPAPEREDGTSTVFHCPAAATE